ncbi:hypothetical protein [Streptomyces sp. NPDC056405]|uniref:hypothetical protein n=1 Tax=Streptomyces sp. NPDC056405 TaxID=3345811 RepID=UPI0035E0788A
MNRDGLLSSAKRWMQAALAAYSRGDGDYDFAVHHLGVATEHLLKAYLSSLHPVLIVDANDLPSLLHATANGDRAGVPVTRIKTLGVVAAYKRCRTLLPRELKVDEKIFASELANARNGVAHVGMHDATEAQQAVVTCFRVVDPLLALLQADIQDFWGDYRDLHDQLNEERADKIQLDLTVKLTKARTLFASRYGSLTEAEQLVVFEAITMGSPFSGRDTSARQDCPACGKTGWLSGWLDVEWANAEGVIDGEDSDDPVLVLHPGYFACPICGLTLEDDELEHASLPLEIVTQHDPTPYMEPDPDFYHNDNFERDRNPYLK